MQKRYGAVEGKVTTAVVRREFRHAERDGLSKQERSDAVRKALLSHPKLDSVKADIRAFQKSERRHAKQVESSTGTASTSAVTTSSQSLWLDQEYTNKNSYVNSRVKADVREPYNILHVLVNSAVYGSGNATARLYTDFTPSTSGSWDIAADYFRKASVEGGAEITFSVFKQSSFGGVTKKTLEQTSSTVQGDKTRSASLDLDSGTNYNLGFEIRSEGAANGFLTFGDAYNDPGPGSNRRRAKVKDFRVRSP